MDQLSKLKSIINDGIIFNNIPISLPDQVIANLGHPNDLTRFSNCLELLISYFCRHPRRIIEYIKEYGNSGITQIIGEKINEIGQVRDGGKIINNFNIWKGTIGEVLAGAYVIGFTNYVVPVYKLRFAPNRRISMQGDDLLGFRFNDEGEPESLLIVEAKYWQDPKAAIKKANETLLKVKENSPTLLNFVIEILDTQNRHLEARQIQNFLNEYGFNFKKEYFAFVVADEHSWKEEYFTEVNSNPATPLGVGVFVMPMDIQDKFFIDKENQISFKNHFDSNRNDIDDVDKMMDNSGFKKDYSNLSAAALASELKLEGRETIEYKLNKLKLEKAAYFLTYTGIREPENSPIERNQLIYEAAKIFERLSLWEIERGEKSSAINFLINSSINYFIAGYNANSKVLINGVLNQIASTELLFPRDILIITNLLLMSDFSSLEDKLAEILYEDINLDENIDRTEEEWFDLLSSSMGFAGDRYLAMAVAYWMHCLRTGSKILIKKTSELFNKAAEVFVFIGEHQAYHLTILLSKMFNRVMNTTPICFIPTIFNENLDEKWYKYLRRLRLGKFPMTLLWKSQIEALKKGLLNEDSLIISMPTSAGKTRAIEFAIFRAIKDFPEKHCVYVVPTRSLAMEVEGSLSSRLNNVGIDVSISILYGGYEYCAFEEEIIDESNVFVLTPEKLDLISRNNEEFISNISLLIIDEAHEIGSPSLRSLRAEFVFSRILYLSEKYNFRVLCLSAVIPNVSDFSRWISGSDEKCIETKWKPTRLRYGYFIWKNNSGQVIYRPLKGEFPNDNFFIPILFKLNDFIDNDRGKFETAARLSLYYSTLGTTLTFTTTKHFVNKIRDILIKILEKNSPEITQEQESLAKKCANILGEEHNLVKAIKLGFCYHHADLPKNVRKLLEYAIRSEIVPLIISTTTLSQGVNLPIRNVIVHSIQFGRIVPMSQFLNTVGRAGRPGYETEGHIVFCEIKDLIKVEKSDLEKSESFITSGINSLINSRFSSAKSLDEFLSNWALASTKQFREDGINYESWGKQKKRNADKEKNIILTMIDSQLLTMAIEESLEESDENDIVKWFEKMLFNVQQLSIENEIIQFKSGLTKRFLAIKRAIPDKNQRKLYYKTGLSVDSNIFISEFIEDIKEELNLLNEEDFLSENTWIILFEKLKQIVEFSDLQRIKVGVFLDWINGKNFKDISERHYDSNIEKAVKDIEIITFLVPWGLNAVKLHLQSLLGEDSTPSIVKNIASLAHHGVSNITSVYAINIGINDRKIAIELAEYYSSKHVSSSYFDFYLWLLELFSKFNSGKLEDDEYNIINLIRDYVQRIDDKFRMKEDIRKDLDFNLIDILFSKIENKNDLIVVKYLNEFLVCTFDYKRIGKLNGENVEKLRKIDRHKRDILIENISIDEKKCIIRVE